MTPEGLNLSKDDTASSTVDEWSRRLGIPAPALLHHAGCGDIKVFFIPPGNYASRYVSVKGLDLDSYDVPRPPALPPEALNGSPFMAGRLFGIYLGAARCAELSKVPHERVAFHSELLHNTLPFIVAINSEKNAWGRDLPPDTRIVMLPTSAPDYLAEDEEKKISIAQHIEKQAWNRSAEEFLLTPVSFLVQARHVRIRDVDMADFLSRIRTFAFIHDMFDGEVIADSLPDYASGKLVELIAANRLFWSESAALNTEEREARRKQVSAYLSGSFKSYCNTMSKPRSLMKFAADAADPYLVPKTFKLPLTPSLTPSMLALLTASKLFWSASITVGDVAEPDKEAVVAFLRSMGVKGNGAESGATLLKPEGE